MFTLRDIPEVVRLMPWGSDPAFAALHAGYNA
jgi:hypothetical protein